MNRFSFRIMVRKNEQNNILTLTGFEERHNLSLTMVQTALERREREELTVSGRDLEKRRCSE